jgi:hypothetical protein
MPKTGRTIPIIYQSSAIVNLPAGGRFAVSFQRSAFSFSSVTASVAKRYHEYRAGVSKCWLNAGADCWPL